MRMTVLALGASGCILLVTQQQDPAGVYPSCGGIGGRTCVDGLVCVDMPDDGCTAGDTGADCSRICVTCEDPLDRITVFTDPYDCENRAFRCDVGQVKWFDECGCGCQAP